MRKKIIKFATDPKLLNINNPQPAKRYIPEWFKSSDKFYDSNKKLKIHKGKTFKTCMPFTDTMTMGYIFELWTDIEVFKDHYEEQFITWKNSDEYQVFAERDPKGNSQMPKFSGYSEKHFSFLHPLFIKTPPGYSCIITQPINRPDLNTYALTGVVDTDKEIFFPGNYPILVKENFEGIISAGTPILQIIPFKREDWVSEEDTDLIKSGFAASNKSSRKLIGWYRDNVWSRKSFE